MLPLTSELLRQFGARLRMARLRRRLSAKQVAERAGMAPMTLRSLERGGAGVTMGAYLSVMQVLGIEKDMDLLAKADPLGRELQDARLPAAARAVASLPDKQLRASLDRPDAPVRDIETLHKPTESARDWIESGGFANAGTLAGLLDPIVPLPKRRR